MPHNFVQLVTLLGTRVRLIVYVVVHKMKCVMEGNENEKETQTLLPTVNYI